MSSLAELHSQYYHLNNQLHERFGQQQALQQKLTDCTNRIQEIDSQSELISKSLVFLQTISDVTRQEVLDKISEIVTDALQKIKDPNLQFKMDLSTERNQLDVAFSVTDKTTEFSQDILQSCGGTLGDIIAFVLRLTLLKRWNPQLSPLMVLDESFKFISVQDQDNLGEFIRKISERLKTQIILITHSEKLTNYSHKVFSVTKTDGVSHVK